MKKIKMNKIRIVNKILIIKRMNNKLMKLMKLDQYLKKSNNMKVKKKSLKKKLLFKMKIIKM